MPVQQFGELLSDPRKLTKHLFKVILAAICGTAFAAYFLDQQLAAFFRQEKVYTHWYQPARKLTDLGLFEVYFFVALASWAFAKWIAPHMQTFREQPDKIDFLRRWGLNFIAALLLSGVITHLIKFTVGRQRPHKSPIFDPYIFTPFTTHYHWHSFSSGHSQVIFTAATMLSVAMPKWRRGWLAFAVLIAFTRVMVTDHFLSDIIFGACVGYVGALCALYWMKLKSQNRLF